MRVKYTEPKTGPLRSEKCRARPGTTAKKTRKTSHLQLRQTRFLLRSLVFHFLFVVFLNRFCRNSSLALRPFDSVGVTCAGISPTCRENARSSSDPGAVAEDKTKSKVQHEASDFVKDEYLIEHYEYQTETSCSDKVKGRLRSHVQFWKEIGAYSNI